MNICNNHEDIHLAGNNHQPDIKDILQKYENSSFAEKFTLNRKQYEILYRLAEGATAREIMCILDESRATYFRRQREAFAKIKAPNKSKAINIFVQHEN